MNIWIWMLVLALLIPTLMIVCGAAFVKSPPKNINAVYGYRTKRSMKNRSTWGFAHKYCGKLWLKAGLILLPVSAAAMLCAAGKSEETIAAVGLTAAAVGIAALIAAIPLTEAAMKKAFDSDGRRRDEHN